MLNFRAPRPLAAALDAWLVAQAEPRPSRSEVIRRLLAQGAEPAGIRNDRCRGFANNDEPDKLTDIGV